MGVGILGVCVGMMKGGEGRDMIGREEVEVVTAMEVGIVGMIDLGTEISSIGLGRKVVIEEGRGEGEEVVEEGEIVIMGIRRGKLMMAVSITLDLR